jgi:hypothetical protein
VRHLLFTLAISLPLWAEVDLPVAVSNRERPSIWDFYRIQTFLKKGERPELDLLEEAIVPGAQLYDYKRRTRSTRLVGTFPGQGPKFRIVLLNTTRDDKRCCIITYASYNKGYPRGVLLLKNRLKEIGFKGHFLYRIGGWPDCEGGSLPLVRIPYAFKPCLFQEAKRLGYELVLWLDSSIRPCQSLEEIFTEIKERGYIFYPAGHTLERYCNRQAMQSLGADPNEAAQIKSVAGGLVGFNLSHPMGQHLLDRWTKAAWDGKSFFSPRCDQSALSIIAHLAGCSRFYEPHRIAYFPEQINTETRFFVDWASIQ